MRGRAKAVINSKGRSNAVDLSFCRNEELISIMPVISADGKVWPPVVIIPGSLQKCLTQIIGNYLWSLGKARISKDYSLLLEYLV